MNVDMFWLVASFAVSCALLLLVMRMPWWGALLVASLALIAGFYLAMWTAGWWVAL